MVSARDVLQRELAQGACPEVWVRFPRQLGDVVFTLPFFLSLQADWNELAASCGVKLRWMAVGHAIGAAIFAEANPDFIAESVIEAGGQGKPDPWHLLRRWKRQRPVAVINLSQSVRLALAAWMSRVPIRAGDVDNRLGFLYHHRFTYRDLPLPAVGRFAPLLKQLTGQDTLTQPILGPHNLGGHRALDLLRAAGWSGSPYVTLAFGTRGYGKRWFPEEEKWPALARLLQEQGLGVVWLGGPDEAELGGRLASLAPGSFDLTGKTRIPEAVALQFHAYGNVAVDTGLAHTAAATGRPLVTLMGPTREQFFTPQGPYSATLRGAEVGAVPAMDTHGSASHRISELRVANLLHALASEAAHQPLDPAAAGVPSR